MLILIAHILCVVFPAQAVDLTQDTGPIHFHKAASGPLDLEYLPLLPNDEVATKNAQIFVKRHLPKLDIRLKRYVNHFILQELNAVLALYLYNFVVKGFRRAALNNLVVRLGDNIRVDFNVSLPFLTTDGTVFVTGEIDEHHFASIGNVSTISNDVKASGVLTVRKLGLPSNTNVFQIVDADINVDINNTMISLTIIQELIEFKITLVEFLNKPVDDVIKSVSRVAFKLINEELAKVPADSVVDYLIPPKPTKRRRVLRPRTPSYPSYSYEYY